MQLDSNFSTSVSNELSSSENVTNYPLLIFTALLGPVRMRVLLLSQTGFQAAPQYPVQFILRPFRDVSTLCIYQQACGRYLSKSRQNAILKSLGWKKKTAEGMVSSLMKERGLRVS